MVHPTAPKFESLLTQVIEALNFTMNLLRDIATEFPKPPIEFYNFFKAIDGSGVQVESIIKLRGFQSKQS